MTFSEEQQNKLKNDAQKWSKILVDAARDQHSFDIPSSACTALSNLLTNYAKLTEEQNVKLISYRKIIADQRVLLDKEKTPKEPRKRADAKETE